MSLYLCVFSGSDEKAGLEVGTYADFNALRRFVAVVLEGGLAGSRFPTLATHSDCDGEWTLSACGVLLKELSTIIVEMKGLPPLEFPGEWQESVARSRGLRPRDAFESFIDVDGEFLLQRLLGLAEVALECGQPILFQ
jgi:hypothetical protein